MNFKFPSRKPQKLNQKGVALLMAMFCVMIMAFLAVELNFDTSVEYILSNKEYHRIKAYDAAKAGMELSLLRIQLFKSINKQYGSQLKGQESLLQMIWSMPFTWPPSIPEETSIADKDQIKTATSDSFMDARYVAQISAEGSKIDINDLDSLSESLKKATKEQLTKIFVQKLEAEDDVWAEKNKNFDYEELINNLQDWVDEDSVSANGGDEKSRYPDADDDAVIPPNRPFQTMDELKMVDGMREDVFQILLPHVTVYGSKGINVNQANAEILKSIDPIITDEMASEIISRRNDLEKGGPFKDENEFIAFISANQQTFNASKIPLLFGNEYNFRIKVTGEFQNVTREIIAIVYDVEAVRDQMIAILDKDNQSQSGPGGSGGPLDTDKDKIPDDQDPDDDNDGIPDADDPNPKSGAGNNPQTPAAGATSTDQKPRVVYWWEN
ncbi:MAG: type II secretion system protein GspK [Bdellovibrionota bacterium]